MENEINLPFKVGEQAEARSFLMGFRGAWFQCKIREISKRKGHIGHVLEYYDFPDEKLKWEQLYQVPPHIMGKAKEKHRELMLRPPYPPIYNEKQMPHFSEISEVTVIVHDAWKVGDLIDWWTNDCYWSGRILQLLGDDKAKIELKPPPLGEGSTYEVFLKDIRPSLDWSPEYGWMMPTQEGDTGRPCARLIKPINQVIGRLPITDTHNPGQETEAGQGTTESSVRLSFSSPVSSNSLAASDELRSTETMETQKQSLGNTVSKEVTQEKSQETSKADTDSGKISSEPVGEVDEKDLKGSYPLKQYRASEGTTLNSMRSDTLEAAILDLEDYVNKVKWLKAILQNGISSSDASKPRWEFVDPRAASPIQK